MQDPLAHLGDDLANLAREGLLRRSPEARPEGLVSFSSNDYLGYASEAAPAVQAGAGASRLISGEHEEHRRAERAFASWLEVEDALVFSSGWAANVGTLAALAGPGDLIVSDALNHASIIDGARLSRATTRIAPHRDLGAIEQALARRDHRRAWVVVESYYSMDADGPDLGALRRLCDAHGAALLVDEAHALGVLGPGGRGRSAEAGVRPDVLIGTLGKAFGSQGAFVAGRRVLREWLWNRARSFVFSTGLSPAAAAAATRSLGWLRERPEQTTRIAGLGARLRSGLERALPADSQATVLGFGHVVPVVLGSPRRAVDLAALLAARGIGVHAIRPPTVPTGSSRIRFTVTARHSDQDVDAAVAAFADAFAALGAIR